MGPRSLSLQSNSGSGSPCFHLLTQMVLTLCTSSLQLAVLAPGFDHNRQVGICVLPQAEKILVGFAGRRRVVLQDGSSREAQVGHGPQRGNYIPTSMIDDPLKLCRGQRSVL